MRKSNKTVLQSPNHMVERINQRFQLPRHGIGIETHMQPIRLDITHRLTESTYWGMPLMHAIPSRQESDGPCRHHDHPQTATKIFQKVDVEIHIDGRNDAIILARDAGMGGSATVGFAIRLPRVQIVYLDAGHRGIGVRLWQRSGVHGTIDQTSSIIPNLKIDAVMARHSSRKGVLRSQTLILRRLQGLLNCTGNHHQFVGILFSKMALHLLLHQMADHQQTQADGDRDKQHHPAVE